MVILIAIIVFQIIAFTIILLYASSVQSAMKSLLERDLVTFSNGTYRVTDYFFAEWIRSEF